MIYFDVDFGDFDDSDDVDGFDDFDYFVGYEDDNSYDGDEYFR